MGTNKHWYKTFPVYQCSDGKWYHFIETWSESHGPYNNRKDAYVALKLYASSVLGDPLKLDSGELLIAERLMKEAVCREVLES